MKSYLELVPPYCSILIILLKDFQLILGFLHFLEVVLDFSQNILC